MWWYPTPKDLVKVSKTYGVNWAFMFTSNETTPFKNLLVAPKEKYSFTEKSRVTYRYKCDRVECDEEYIGGLQGPLGKDSRNTLGPLPTFMAASSSQVIKPSLDNFTIVGKESHNLSWKITEAIYIWVNDPSLYRHTGKYWLLYILDQVLFSTPDLKSWVTLQHQPWVGVAGGTNNTIWYTVHM